MASRPLRLMLSVAVAAVGLPLACARPWNVERPQATVPLSPQQSKAAWEKAQGVFETRCVVCHGCYDAPCQLKLGTFEGIDRGATAAKVYDAGRLFPAEPTRLGVDAHDALGWRKKGFHPILPEGYEADPRASLLLRMLELKRVHPLPAVVLPKDFTLDLDRAETCVAGAHFDDYAKEHPLWGMPYALPGLAPAEEAAVVDWVNAGAPHAEPEPLPEGIRWSVAAWEAFLNEPSLKSRLMARYVYEHLFLASLSFDEIDPHVLFRLVRSRGPSPAPVDEIATRRPFEDPKVDRVYYRFVRRIERPLEKTLMPYPLGPARLQRLHELFLAPTYEVERLPSYEPEVAANPFRAFQAIPAESRYRFMLEDAQFTMMGFIKGPVCRGQVALNVIEDRFWIMFLNPAVSWMTKETAFLADVKQDLDMPAEEGSRLLTASWLRYGAEHEKYVTKRTEFLEELTKGGHGVNLDLVWDGDNKNPNAALTVFRHFDSATVVQGLIGPPPKTAWVVGYPLLERIHYLLVAGFDVYGNVTHQVTTRLYMDFLRMEGEANFLLFLPPEQRKLAVGSWYRGVTGEAKERVERELAGFGGAPSIRYGAGDAERELFRMIERRVENVVAKGYDLQRVQDASMRADLDRLEHVEGKAASWMPEMSFVAVEGAGGRAAHFTVLRDSAHTNVMTLFHEDDRRVPAEDALVVVPGFLGAYPNALFDVPREHLGAFVLEVSKLDGPESYRALRSEFGVLRASDRFWKHSDRIHEDHRKEAPESGLFDFNRLEAY
ncbi:MAG: fatty acid cis/trans isomerase [Polyangiaceae bacterium]